jgi:hypothetical protein
VINPAQLTNSRLASDPYARHVLARLLDFFGGTTPWPRRLWDVGAVLALREAAEAGEWSRMRVLSPGAVSWYLHSLERQLGPDRGLGDAALRKELIRLLRSGLGSETQDRRRLIQLIPVINSSYIAAWRNALDSERPPLPEHLAKAIATHLLDSGHSSGQLYRWARSLRTQEDVTLADLLARADTLAAQDDQLFDVLVPFATVPDSSTQAEHLPEWCPAQQVVAWFAANGLRDRPRQNGAFRYQVRAKDAVAAAKIVGDRVRRMAGRRAYSRGSRKLLEPTGKMWVAGWDAPLPLLPPERGAKVLTLEIERAVYSITSGDRLDEALELAAPLNAGSAASAAAGSWSAIESLLFHPGDTREGRAVAGDRLAAIVTCSWPRAELTALSYQHKLRSGDTDRISMRLTAKRGNLWRSVVVSRALSSGEKLNLTAPSDIAAAERMTAVLRAPHQRLKDVCRTFQGAFRRLYRQRNIVVHGGYTQAIALDSALRVAAPLVGVGLDRLVHAQHDRGPDPLGLAARAANSIALVDDPLGPNPTTLLD